MKNILTKLYESFLTLVQIFKNSVFLLILVIVGCLAISIPDQTVSFFEIIATNGLSYTFVVLIFALVVWSIVIWNAFKITFSISTELSKRNNTEYIISVFPRVFSMMPFITVILIFGKKIYDLSKAIDDNKEYLVSPEEGKKLSDFTTKEVNTVIKSLTDIQMNIYWQIIVVAICLIVIYIMYRIYDNNTKELYKNFVLKNEHFPNLKQDLDRFLKYPGSKTHFICLGSLSFFLLISFMIPVRSGFHNYITPAGIGILGIAFITYLSSIIMYFNDSNYRPISAFVIILFLVNSAFNDNTQIRTMGDPNDVLDKNERPSIEEHFKKWLISRYKTKNDTIPVIIVATEGGGIRAANWTLHNLNMVNTLDPNFNKYIYGISGVSGGGVGAAFYLAYKHDFPNQKIDSAKYNQIQEQDYLSPVMYGLFFQNTLQMFLPFKISGLDRNKLLEDSWSTCYAKIFKKETFEDGFLKLYRNPDQSYNYNLPSLFLNGTHAEGGRKIITSNLSFDNFDGNDSEFYDVLDTYEIVNKDMPLKTVASLCSRFPIVTSGGYFTNGKKGDEKKAGHITDGGYFDNTGLETALQLYNTLCHTKIEGDSINYKIHLVFFQNSDSSIPKVESKELLNGITTITGSLLNSYFRGSVTRENIYNQLSQNLNPSLSYQTIKLPVKRVRKWSYPLGWYMPKYACVNLRKEAIPFYSNPYIFAYKDIRNNIINFEGKNPNILKEKLSNVALFNAKNIIDKTKQNALISNPKRLELYTIPFKEILDLPIETPFDTVVDRAIKFIKKDSLGRIKSFKSFPKR